MTEYIFYQNIENHFCPIYQFNLNIYYTYYHNCLMILILYYITYINLFCF